MQKLILVLLLIPFTLSAQPPLNESGFEDWCLKEINDRYRECLRGAVDKEAKEECHSDRDENEQLCSTNMAIS